MKPMLLAMLILAQGAPTEDNGYPPGLFEHSPEFPDTVGGHTPHKVKPHAPQKSDDGDCHHYRDWFYPYPQPC